MGNIQLIANPGMTPKKTQIRMKVEKVFLYLQNGIVKESNLGPLRSIDVDDI